MKEYIDFMRRVIDYGIAFECQTIDNMKLDEKDKQYLKTSVKGIYRNIQHQLESKADKVNGQPSHNDGRMKK